MRDVAFSGDCDPPEPAVRTTGSAFPPGYQIVSIPLGAGGRTSLRSDVGGGERGLDDRVPRSEEPWSDPDLEDVVCLKDGENDPSRIPTHQRVGHHARIWCERAHRGQKLVKRAI